MNLSTTNLPLAMNLTFVGLVVVFIALILLAYIITLFSKILSFRNKEVKNDAPKVPDEAPVRHDIPDEDSTEALHDASSEEELVAVLTAAVLAGMESRPDLKIKVKSFRRIPQAAPAWNSMGRDEYISSRL